MATPRNRKTRTKSDTTKGAGRAGSASRDVVCRHFAEVYLRHGNALRAYREAMPHSKANDNTACKEASKLLHDERTQLYIDRLREAACRRAEAKLSEWIANELRIVRYDPARLFDEVGNLMPIAEMDPDTRFAIQSIDVEEEKVERHESDGVQVVTRTRVKKIKAHSKDGAQDRLGKHLGAYQKDNEQNAPRLFDSLPREVQIALYERLAGGSGGAR